MPSWKKNIFARTIKARMEAEQRTAEDIIKEYPKLTDAEQKEILEAIKTP
jgi:hypothetical protein